MRLVAWWRELVARWRASTRLQDNVTAAATFLGGLVLNLAGLTGLLRQPRLDALADASPWWHTVVLAAGCTVLLFKRRHPVLVLGLGLPLFAADLALGGSVAMVLVLFDLLFSVGLYGGVRARRAVMTAVVVLIGTGSVVGGLATRDVRVTVMVALQLGGLLVVPLWWAGNVRQQRDLGALTARRAVDAERSAMARDLHDAISSHLSTSAIHSAATLALPPDTERDRAALRTVRASSLAALDEMRSMIMLLRAAEAPPEEAVVPSGLERLPELVESAREAGLSVSLDTQASEDIPALVDQAAYRIVREALTNAAKHAPGSRAAVRVESTGGALRLTVTNTLTDQVPAPGARAGLAGMSERAAFLGGTVSAGRDGQVWRVEATLPLRHAVAAPPERPLAGSDR